MSEHVVTATHGAIRVLTLHKPQKLNALDAEMLAAIANELEACDRDDAVAATVLTGTGRSFSTGFDMSGGGSTSTAPPQERLRANLQSFLSIWRARKPVVAAVDGYALGAGCILANLCDIVIASERAIFGEPEIRYFNPASITILPFIIGLRRAKEILFFGKNLDAKTALDWGIVNMVLPTEGFFEAALATVQPLAHIHPAGLVAVKRSVNRGAEIGGFLSALEAGLDEIAPLYAPDSPTARTYRREIEEHGFKGYIRRRDALFGS
jgi:enoyl-CoA hydratase/carnithine racemase